MTITILWWHFPALLTAAWAVAAVLPSGSATIWDDWIKTAWLIFGALIVLAVWVAAMAWRILT